MGVLRRTNPLSAFTTIPDTRTSRICPRLRFVGVLSRSFIKPAVPILEGHSYNIAGCAVLRNGIKEQSNYKSGVFGVTAHSIPFLMGRHDHGVAPHSHSSLGFLISQGFKHRLLLTTF